MSESLGHDARALIDQATQARGDEPTLADRERVRARLALAMVATTGGFAVAGTSKIATSGSLVPAAATPSVAAGAVGAAGAAGAIGAAGVALATKIVLAVALVGALGGGSAMVLARRSVGASAEARTSPNVAMPMPVAAPVPSAPMSMPVAPVLAVAPAASAPSGAPAPVPTIAAAASPAPSAAIVSAAASSPPDVADELVLLREARSALKAGDPERSLHLLAEHARRYPHGALTEEREAARAVATCAIGGANAAAAVAHFFRVYPRSVHASRVRAACASLTSSPTPTPSSP